MKTFWFILILTLFSCSTSGPVDSNLNDSADIPVVDTPKGFHSNLDELDQIHSALSSMGDWASFKYQALIQREDEIISEMENLQTELTSDGGIDLIPGKSYSFKIQSFCVHPGAYRPVLGDGFRVARLQGKASKWLPEILEKLPQVSVNQSHVQHLIWELLTGAHYDDLSEENKRTLELFFNDGLSRFGSSTLNQMGTTLFNSVAPVEITKTIDDFSNLHDEALRFQGNFKKLEALFAPNSGRQKAIPVGWMQMKEGYLLKVTSHGFPETRIDLYLPDERKSGRNPQSKSLFKLSHLVALPSVGQRLALSHKLNLPQKTNNDRYCKKLQEFKPKNCFEIGDSTREKILSIANPSHFLKTRYQSPPDRTKPIEEETDCSRFTQQIYKKAGMEYLYSGTATFHCLNVFKEVSQDQGKPGDLVLYRSHIGILSKNGNVISATVGGPKKRSQLDPENPDFLPSITELPVDQAGSGTYKIIRWSCP